MPFGLAASLGFGGEDDREFGAGDTGVLRTCAANVAQLDTVKVRFDGVQCVKGFRQAVQRLRASSRLRQARTRPAGSASTAHPSFGDCDACLTGADPRISVSRIPRGKRLSDFAEHATPANTLFKKLTDRTSLVR